MNAFRADDERGPEDAFGIVEAARDGDVEKLRAALAAGVSLQARERDFTPLMTAAYFGQLEAFELLLDAGADPAEGDPLLLAIQQGHAALVRAWAERSLPVNAPPGADTPLMFAAHAGQVEIVKLLLDAGADVNARDLDRMTALSMALQEERREVAALLRQAGAVVDRTDPFFPFLPPDQDRIDLSAAAEQPAFQMVLDDLTDLGEAPRLSAELDGVFEIECRDPAAQAALEATRGSIGERGAHLVRTERSDAGLPARYRLLPTGDKYNVLAALGTSGEEHGKSACQIADWLRQLENKHPFTLVGGDRHFLEGCFTAPVKNAKQVARLLQQFCPDAVAEDGSVEQLAEQLERSRRFVLSWE